MSKLKVKGYNWGSLQERIILHLAKNGPKNINRTAKEISSHYKSTHTAFTSLKEKGFIKKVSTMTYPQYWLTFEGLFLALISGSNPKILINTYEKLHGKSEEMDLVFELANILPSEELGRLYNSCKFTKEGVEIYLPIPMNPKTAKIWRKALKKSPKYQKIVYRILKQAIDELPKEGVKP